jgi:hypothetical protein
MSQCNGHNLEFKPQAWDSAAASPRLGIVPPGILAPIEGWTHPMQPLRMLLLVDSPHWAAHGRLQGRVEPLGMKIILILNRIVQSLQ